MKHFKFNKLFPRIFSVGVCPYLCLNSSLRSKRKATFNDFPFLFYSHLPVPSNRETATLLRKEYHFQPYVLPSLQQGELVKLELLRFIIIILRLQGKEKNNNALR